MPAFPCAAEYIFVVYLFTHGSSYLLIPYPYIAPLSFPLPTGIH